MELELEHIAPYLPYELNFYLEFDSPKGRIVKLQEISTTKKIVIVGGNRVGVFFLELEENSKLAKPILRPLNTLDSYFSLLDDEKEVREFTNTDYLNAFRINNLDDVSNIVVEYLPVGLFNLLVKHHFDVFGLIEQDLAVNIFSLSISERLSI